MNTAGLGLAGLRHKNSRCGGPSDKQWRLAKEEASVLCWIISRLPSVYLFFLSFCFCIFPDIFPLYLLPPLKMLFDPPKLEPLNLFLILPPSIYVTLYSSLLYFSSFVSTYICKSLLFSLHSSLHMHIIQFINRVSSCNISTFTNVFLFSLIYN